MHLLSGRRALHIPSRLTLPHNQVWTRTLHFSWLTLGKEEWWGREKAKQQDWGEKYFQPKYLLNQSHENSGAIQYWTEEMRRKHLTDEATCLWELSSALLLFLFHFYSSTFLLEFSLSDIMDVLVCVYTCVQEREFIVCKTEPPRGYSNISFSWTVKTMNSHDRVSELGWEGKSYIYIFRCLRLIRNNEIVQNHCREKHFCDRTQRPRT